MREIKFRVWDISNKRMFENVQLSNFDAFLRSSRRENENDFVVTQFTGLLDKSGKEIYEGDIIEFYKDAPFQILWNDEFGKLMYCYKDGRGAGGFTKRTAKRATVIGNIYENPELLQ